jgi:serine O-acetyltransferase
MNGVLPVNPITAKILLFSCRHHLPVLSKLFRVLFNCDIYCKLPLGSVFMPHPYGIVIHSKTVLGHGVTIMQQVTLGGRVPGVNEAPMIGNNVYIGAGAKVLGKVKLGDGCIVGANAVVTKDVPANATVVGANRILIRKGH